MKPFFRSRFFQKYKLLMDDAQELILYFDLKGRIIDANIEASKELGYGEEIYRISIYDIFKEAFQYENNELKIDPRYQKNAAEAIAYHKNQTCFPVELKISAVNNEKQFIGVCIATNISKNKEAWNEVRELRRDRKSINRYNNEIMANITHELRTPVNGIVGFSNNLLDTKLTNEQEQAVKIILQCCDNMNTTINHLLDYAKMSNNKLVLEAREFSFYEFIKRIISLNLVHINEKGLNLLLDISDDIPDRLVGDEIRLEQVLNNLFSNAIKFTAIGQIGLEVIKTWETDQSVELFFVLMDTGIGISREEKDKLFKSFSQVDSSITRKFGGTGLGLSICKMIVEAMHGTIEVDSEKNKGSTFSFSVRLGIPRVNPVEHQDNDHSLYSEEPYADILEPGLESEEEAEVSDIEDLSRMLQEVNKVHYQHINAGDSMKDTSRNLLSILEMLSICMEMDNWEKAEEIAYYLRKLIPKENLMTDKKVFRLLLAVRKGNRKNAMAILNEIKSELPKEI